MLTSEVERANCLDENTLVKLAIPGMPRTSQLQSFLHPSSLPCYPPPSTGCSGGPQEPVTAQLIYRTITGVEAESWRMGQECPFKQDLENSSALPDSLKKHVLLGRLLHV